MAGKIQVPAIGGLRKVIRIPDAQVSTATTLQGYAGQTLTVAQLKTLLSIQPVSPSIAGSGGSGGGGSIIVGPGLAGGGAVVGSVPIYLTAPIPYGISDGGDGDDGLPGPPGMSITGARGVTGAGGPAGPAVYLEADAGQDAEPPIPGGQGPTGNPGASGLNGIPVFMISDDGMDGDQGAPGAPGAAGSSGGGTSFTAPPGSAPNLVIWAATDKLAYAAGSQCPLIPSPNPQLAPLFLAAGATATPNSAVISAAALNGLPTLDFPGTVSSCYSLQGWAVGPSVSGQMTAFFVINPLATNTFDLLSGASNSMDIQVDAASKLEIVQTFVASHATSTTALTASTWQQVMVQWNNATKAYTFRIARAAAGSGTAAAAFTGTVTPVTSMFYNQQGNVNYFGGRFAECLIYNRALSGTEISAVEAYLLAKWGV